MWQFIVIFVGIILVVIGYMYYMINHKFRKIENTLAVSDEYIAIKKKAAGTENYDLEKLQHLINNGSNSNLSKHIVELYNNNFDMRKIHENLAKGLDDVTLEYGIIRMDILEKNTDISKLFAGLVTLLIFLVTAYNSFAKDLMEPIKYGIIVGAILSLLLSVFVVFSLVKLVADQKGNHSPVAFFKGLFEYELKIRKNKQDSDKEKS